MSVSAPGFTEVRRQDLPWLGATVHELEHERSGARFLHVAAPVRDTFFDAVYRTVCDNSTGLPHITEHTVSGGSRKFPQGAGSHMYRRSLVTDLNGMTSADHTQYYFASPHERDVRNWIAYMVDGTLHPLRREDTFLRQRGHLEHRVPDDPSSPLRYMGVIYNEQKAVFAVPMRHAMRALMGALFPGHFYAHDAGGDPRHIPALTYQEYLDFHARHYHPGNGWYVSFGPAPLELILRSVEENGLDDFERRPPVDVPPVPVLSEPVSVRAAVPGGSAFSVLGWASTTEGDAVARACLEIAAEALFDEAGRRVRTFQMRRTVTTVEVAGVSSGQDLLELAERGIDRARLDAALERWELRRRLDLREAAVDAVMPALCYDGDPLEALDLDVLAQLVRQALADGGREIVRRELLDNPHRALAVMEPDVEMLAREEAFEAELVERLAAELAPAQRGSIVADTQRIQNLVVVDRAPVECLDPRTAEVAPLDITGAAPGGVLQRTLVFPLGRGDDDVLEWLWLLPSLLPDLRPVFATDARGERCLAWLQADLSGLDSGRLDEAAARLQEPPEFSASEVTTAAAALAARLQQSLMGEAQPHLMRLAGSRLRRHLALEHDALGLGALRRARDLGDAGLAAERCTAAAQKLLTRTAAPEPWDDAAPGGPDGTAATTDIPVAFNGMAWRLSGLSAPAAVLAQQMRYGHLQSEVGRKGQAYGVDCEALAEHGLLWVSSRRDPNIRETYQAIDEAVAIAARREVSETDVEDSILSAYRTTMPAETAAEEARRALIGRLTGRTPEVWREYHERLRAVTLDDLASAAAELKDGVRATLCSAEAARANGNLFEAVEAT